MERHIGPARLATLVGACPDDRTAYRWVAERIGRLVVDGQLPHETRLPGERAAATAFGLSRTTVAHAYELLRERGYAEARQGSGTRIRVPGGQALAGGEPLWGDAVSNDQTVSRSAINLTNAAPAAVNGLADRFEAATAKLGAYTSGGGYFRDGVPELREAIAQRYTDRGLPTSPSDILVTTGALAGVAAAVNGLLRPGARVMVDDVSYPNTMATLRGNDARLYPWSLQSRTLMAGAKAHLLMPDFQNPTAYYMDDAERAQLAAEWKQHGVLGIVDETSVDLWWDEKPSALPMGAHAPSCVTVGSASKTYWGGLRIGWVRAPRAHIGAVRAARMRLDLGASVLEQLVVADLLRDQPGLDAERRASLRQGRDILRSRIMAACPGWTCERPAGGLSLWWSLPTPASTNVVEAAARRGLSLTPSSAFAVDGRALEGRLRTPFTASHDELEQAAEILGQTWADVAR